MNKITVSLLAGMAAISFASVGYAADLIVDAPVVVEPGIVDAGGNWDGAYVGVFAGYGSSEFDHTGSADDPDDLGGSPFGPGGADGDASGWLVGLTAGADFSVTEGIVLGVAGDIAWANLSGEETYDGDFLGDVDFTYDLNWQGSVRGRVGFDGGAFLPYLTAGLAFANASHTNDIDAAGEDGDDVTHMGWTVGAGVEFAVSENMSLDLQYRYTDLGSEEYDMGADGFNPVIDLTSHAVTAGVNFRF